MWHPHHKVAVQVTGGVELTDARVPGGGTDKNIRRGPSRAMAAVRAVASVAPLGV
jgi:hypothetical protein